MQITEKLYKEAVNSIIKFEETANQLYKNYGIDIYDSDAASLEQKFIAVLEHVTNDVSKDQSDLSYFLFELDAGREWEPGTITDEDGNDIPMKTLDDLWNEVKKKNKC